MSALFTSNLSYVTLPISEYRELNKARAQQAKEKRDIICDWLRERLEGLQQGERISPKITFTVGVNSDQRIRIETLQALLVIAEAEFHCIQPDPLGEE